MRSMYGTRDAPFIWQEEVRKVMKKLQFQSSMLQPAVYHHAPRKINVVAHVDDFLCTGRAADLKWLESMLKAKFDITATHVGDDAEKELRYLNRTLRWTEEGLEIESDGKHAATLLK